MPTATHPTLAHVLATAERPVFGFEFFPPKDEAGVEQLRTAVDGLRPLGPDFVAVTYGANGSNRARTLAETVTMASLPMRTVGHLTIAGQSRAEIEGAIEAYAAAGIRHILAIRGDMPGGPTVPFEKHPDGLSNATELVRLIKSRGEFCVGVAAFPDPHPQAKDPALDARLLAEKAEAGAEFAITQFFFNPDRYFEMVQRVRALGCSIPILAGIMPVTNVNQIERFAGLSGAALPDLVVQRLREVGDDRAAVRRVGSQIATELAVALLRGGAPGLQFFTQNRSLATREIFSMLLERRW